MRKASRVAPLALLVVAMLSACTGSAPAPVTVAATSRPPTVADSSAAPTTSPSPAKTRLKPDPTWPECSPRVFRVDLEAEPGTASMLLLGNVRLMGSQPCWLLGNYKTTVLDGGGHVVQMRYNPNAAIHNSYPLRPNDLIVFTTRWLQPFCGNSFPYSATFSFTGVTKNGLVPVKTTLRRVTPPKCPTAWGGDVRPPRGLIGLGVRIFHTHG
jgi:hypothetical protein